MNDKLGKCIEDCRKILPIGTELIYEEGSYETRNPNFVVVGYAVGAPNIQYVLIGPFEHKDDSIEGIKSFWIDQEWVEKGYGFHNVRAYSLAYIESYFSVVRRPIKELPVEDNIPTYWNF